MQTKEIPECSHTLGNITSFYYVLNLLLKQSRISYWEHQFIRDLKPQGFPLFMCRIYLGTQSMFLWNVKEKLLLLIDFWPMTFSLKLCFRKHFLYIWKKKKKALRRMYVLCITEIYYIFSYNVEVPFIGFL